MLVLREADPSAGSCPVNHPRHIAVRRLGARLGQTPEENDQGFTHLLVVVDKFSKWIEA
jgi:hypothetical protein